MSQSKTSNRFAELVTQCDSLIRAGKISEVSDLILTLNFAQIPRSARQDLAKICRRINLISQGLRLLHPIIRNEKENIDPPTPKEICEYAVLLSRNGSIQEALTLLEGLDSTGVPEVLLYSAYCHISNWDYLKAIPLIEKFLSAGVDEYTQLIARVNLISAYLVVNQFDQAGDLLAETIPMADQAKASRLLGNCYEMKGRLYLYRDNFSASREALNQALDIFGSHQIYDRLFIDKWQSVMSALEQKSAAPLTQFRQEALAQKDWESVREADLFTVKVSFDQNLLDYLSFGTPMPAYRERIQKEIGAKPSESFMIGEAGDFCLDLMTGQLDGAEGFNPGKKIHQVVAALVKDFYVPRNIGTLFSELYPNEYFDINSSPRRVRELLRRTRQWLEQSQIPAEILHSQGTFQFCVQGSFGIRIPWRSVSIESDSVHWLQLKSKFPVGVAFTAKEACALLHWARSSFLLAIEKPLRSGELQRTGQGKSIVYRISDLAQKAVA